jgi:PHS family inorganic phosphate transporter-like MFS transporter
MGKSGYDCIAWPTSGSSEATQLNRVTAASLVALVILSVYKKSILADGSDHPMHMDACWRLLIGLGCVPGAAALYFRLTVPETPRFTMDVERNIKLAVRNIQAVLSANGVSPGIWMVDEELSSERVEVPRSTLRSFRQYFGQWRNLKMLIGVAYSWFALDVRACQVAINSAITDHPTQVAFYGLGLNTSKIITKRLLQAINIGHPPSLNATMDSFNNIYSLSVFMFFISGTSLIPGYWVSFVFIDWWGRKPIQLMGFTILAILFLIMGAF